MLNLMVDTIVRAASIPKWTQSAEPFSAPMPKQHALIVGGTHLIALSPLFPTYALEATVIIPTGIAELDRDLEFGRAAEFEEANPKICKGIGMARDLGGFNNDTADLLVICSLYPNIRDQFLAQSWRVVKELGKLIVFTQTEIPISHLGSFGMANPTYYPVEGFYIGSMRKSGSLYSRN